MSLLYVVTFIVLYCAISGKFKCGEEKTVVCINFWDNVLTPLVIYFEVITTSLKLLSWSHFYKVKLIHRLFHSEYYRESLKNSSLQNSYCRIYLVEEMNYLKCNYFFLKNLVIAVLYYYIFISTAQLNSAGLHSFVM